MLFQLGALQKQNDCDCTEALLPGRITIGTNGGGELYGIDSSGCYFNVPEIIEEEYVFLLGDDIEELPEK